MDEVNSHWIAAPVHNCKEHTLQFVQDALGQNLPTKVLIFDNGSTDDTVSSLVALQEPRLHVVQAGQNIGVGPAWNQIAHLVFGGILDGLPVEEVLICNNDIRLRPDTLQSLQIPKGGFVTPVNVGSWEKVLAHDAEAFPVPVEPILKGGPDFSCFLLRKWFYDTLGGFPECYWPGWFEDNETHWIAKCKGLDSNIFSIAFPYWHIGSQTLKQNPEIQKINSEAFERNRELYIARWGGLPGHEIYKTPYGH